MESLEKKIGYRFGNPLLLAEALTHPSLSYESQVSHLDNQRLEFLGDAVLQLILTDHLFQLFPDFAEGLLTKLRSRLVSRDALEEFSRELELGEYLQMGRGEAANGGRTRPSNLADAFEALIGAIYLDGGIATAGRMVLDLCSTAIDRIALEPDEVNPKGELQEMLQAISATSPSYRVIDESGPAHERNFSVAVEWDDVVLGQGSGNNKKQAEIDAARNALENRLWKNSSDKL